MTAGVAASEPRRGWAAWLPPGSRRRELVLAALVVALGAAAYAPALSGGFVYDDRPLLEEVVRAPLGALWTGAAAPDYLPLTWTALWLEWRLFGEAPLGYHAVNVALHLAAALLLWRVLAGLRVRGAALAALLFAVHPVTVESVAWISELKNTLSAALALGSALAWLRHRETRGAGAWLVSATLFGLALLAKSSVVMLPVVYVAIVWLREGAFTRRDARAVAPFFVMSGVFGALTAWFQWSRALQPQMLAPRGWLERAGGAGWALASYVEKAFAPVRLGFVYPGWPLTAASPAFLVPLLALAGASVVLWRARRGWARPMLLATGYHALMLLPVLGLVDIAWFHVSPVSNHLQYGALVGPVALVGWAGARVARRRGGVLLVGAVVAALAAQTFRRSAAFEDDLALWRAASREQPGSLYAARLFAAQLGERGRVDEAMKALAVPIEHGDEATRHRARALWLFYAAGPTDEAVAEARQAGLIRPEPEFVVMFGQMLARAGRFDVAVELLRPLVASAPRYGDARYWLALSLAGAGSVPAAHAVLDDGKRLAPDDPRFDREVQELAAGEGLRLP